MLRRWSESRARATFWLLAGTLPLVAALPIYPIAIQLHKQVALPRLLGLLEVMGLALVAMAAIAAVLTRRLAPHPALAGAGRALWFGAVAASLMLTGLAVFFNQPRLAPPTWLVGAGVAWLALVVTFWRKSPADQALTLRMLAVVGLGVLAALALAVPYVAVAAWTDQPRNPRSPMPPAATEALASAPRRIVLVTFDELRARTTSLVDPALDATPALAALAGEATWFSACHAAGDGTVLSMPTVLSGLRPPTVFSGDRNAMNVLRQGNISGVAAYLRAAGYHTAYAGMLAAPESFGMQAEYDESWWVAPFLKNPFNGQDFLPLREVASHVTPQRFKQRRSSKFAFDVHPIHSVVEQSLEMYRSGSERSFLWVHMGLPHHPYYVIPPADFDKPIKPNSYRRVHPFLHKADAAFYTEAYNSYTRFSDAMFGQLIDGLRASPQWEDTLLIVTADHGTRLEPAKKHVYASGEVDEDITHVPLLVHAPGQRRPARVDAAVGHEDIVPTILSAVYPVPPAGFAGGPLLSGLDPERVGSTWTQGKGDRAAYQGRFKLVVSADRTSRLTDWRADPLGVRDLSGAHAETAAALRTWLARELPADEHR